MLFIDSNVDRVYTCYIYYNLTRMDDVVYTYIQVTLYSETPPYTGKTF